MIIPSDFDLVRNWSNDSAENIGDGSPVEKVATSERKVTTSPEEVITFGEKLSQLGKRSKKQL